MQGNLSIPERLHRARNQFIGHPINQAAHIGFSFKPRRSSGASVFPKCHVSGSPLVGALRGGCDPATVRASRAHRVGSFFSAVIKPSPLVGEAPFLFQLPQTVSVGSKQPPAIPLMACADIRRGKRSVAPGISTRHEFGDDDIPPSGADVRAIFEEDEARPDRVDGAEDFRDEATSRPCEAGATASN